MSETNEVNDGEETTGELSKEVPGDIEIGSNSGVDASKVDLVANEIENDGEEKEKKTVTVNGVDANIDSVEITENEDKTSEIETIEGDGNPTVAKDGEDVGEVITVMDTGEEDLPCKTIPDVVFYDLVTEEEKLFYSENLLSYDVVDAMKVQCTACWKQVNHHVFNNIQRHPDLGVALCRACKDFYEDGEWEKDDEGTDMYCKWCGNGGEVLGCDKCCQVFCKRCITRNLGRAKFSQINDSDEWSCFSCDPQQIYKERALMLSISKWAHERKNKKRQKEKDKIMKKRMESTKKKAEQNKIKKEKKIETEVGKIENFIDENIHEAFDTLEIYQKCLEDERRKWIRVRKTMNAGNAATVSKSLRRIFAITKQNMELLDMSLVQGYGEHFPDEVVETKLRFSIGGAAKLTSSPAVTTPSKSPSKSTPKKVLPKKPKNNKLKKKKVKSEGAGDGDDDCIEVEEIVVNGEHVYTNTNGDASCEEDSFIDPSLLCSVEITGVENRGSEEDAGWSSGPTSTPSTTTPKKKKKTSPTSGQKHSGPLRLSKNMFKRKKGPSITPKIAKRPRNDSEIEEITLDDDDDSTGYVSQATLDSLANQAIMAKVNKFVQDDDGDSDVSLY